MVWTQLRSRISTPDVRGGVGESRDLPGTVKVGDEDGGVHRWVGGRHNVTCNELASRKVFSGELF